LVVVGSVVHLDSGAVDGPERFSNATLSWIFNQELNTGAFDGSCNHVSAGRTDGSAAQYRGTDGDVTVEKLDATSTYRTITDWAARCRDAGGTAVTAGGTRRLGLRIRLTGGEGTRDTSTGATTVEWRGTFSANIYDELVPLWFSDPRLTVSPTGDTILTATIAGFASSLENPEIRSELPARPDVVIARSSGVQTDGEAGFAVVPMYLGVTYDSADTPQSRTSPSWGAWPAELVRTMERSGTAAYWYSTGGASDTRKVPAVIDVHLGATTTPTTTTPTTTTPTTTAPAMPPAADRSDAPAAGPPGSGPSSPVEPPSRQAARPPSGRTSGPADTTDELTFSGVAEVAGAEVTVPTEAGSMAPSAPPAAPSAPLPAERTVRRLTASLRYRSMSSVFEPSWNPGAPGRVRVTYTVENTGDVTVAARGRTEVTTSLGPDPESPGDTSVRPLAPGRTRTVVAVVDGVWPGFGTRTSVELEPFLPGDPDVDLAAATVTAHSATDAWPWRPAIALTAVACAAALVAVIVTRRRHNRSEPLTPSKPNQTGATT